MWWLSTSAMISVLLYDTHNSSTPEKGIGFTVATPTVRLHLLSLCLKNLNLKTLRIRSRDCSVFFNSCNSDQHSQEKHITNEL